MGPISCPETSVRNYHYLLRYKPQERSSHLLRGANLRDSHADLWLYCVKNDLLIRFTGVSAVYATHIAAVQCCVTTFAQRSQHSFIFYRRFCLSSNNNTDGHKTENRNCSYMLFSSKIWCDTVASSNRNAHLYQTGGCAQLHSKLICLEVFIKSVLVFGFAIWRSSFFSPSPSPAKTTWTVLQFCDSGVGHFSFYFTPLLVSRSLSMGSKRYPETSYHSKITATYVTLTGTRVKTC